MLTRRMRAAEFGRLSVIAGTLAACYGVGAAIGLGPAGAQAPRTLAAHLPPTAAPDTAGQGFVAGPASPPAAHRAARADADLDHAFRAAGAWDEAWTDSGQEPRAGHGPREGGSAGAAPVHPSLPDWQQIGEPILASFSAGPGPAMPRHLSPRPVAELRVASAGQLAELFRRQDYSLDDVRQGEAVPALRIERVPEDLAGMRDGSERKWLFIKAVLPIVLEVNERILADREELARLAASVAEGGAPTAVERLWLGELAERYGVAPDRLDELLRRVDVVPPSMAIAQAGAESGWGTSYAARVGNALFGQIQSVGRHAVAVPWRPGPQMPQPFATIGDSVEAYMDNLNTHPAYAAFRADRAAMRLAGQTPDGHRLIGHLLRYSELGQGYIGFVRQLIRENRLQDFDGAKLAPL